MKTLMTFIPETNFKTNIMKKLIYLFLTVLIVACSSGDDDSNSAVTLNAQFVGSWLLEFDDGDGSFVIEFNADGTGSDTETTYNGETYTSSFTWSTTSTQLAITDVTDGIEEVEVVEYNFITNDQVRIIYIEDGESVILNRIAD